MKVKRLQSPPARFRPQHAVESTLAAHNRKDDLRRRGLSPPSRRSRRRLRTRQGGVRPLHPRPERRLKPLSHEQKPGFARAMAEHNNRAFCISSPTALPSFQPLRRMPLPARQLRAPTRGQEKEILRESLAAHGEAGIAVRDRGAFFAAVELPQPVAPAGADSRPVFAMGYFKIERRTNYCPSKSARSVRRSSIGAWRLYRKSGGAGKNPRRHSRGRVLRQRGRHAASVGCRMRPARLAAPQYARGPRNCVLLQCRRSLESWRSANRILATARLALRKFSSPLALICLTYQTQRTAYRVSAGSFFQTNRHLTDELVRIVTNGQSGKVALDLYAGVGLFSTALASDFHHVVSVESSQTSSGDLSYNQSCEWRSSTGRHGAVPGPCGKFGASREGRSPPSYFS